MSDIFTDPDDEELVDMAGLGSPGLAEIDPEVPLDDGLPEDDFKALWRTLERLSSERILEEVGEQLSDAPQRRREVLTTWMAQELGYSRVWRRRSALTREPLWDALSHQGFSELSDSGQKALAMVGRAMQPARSYLHPSVALATLALWRHSDDRTLYDEAQHRLRQRALPDDPEWLYEVVDVFLKDEADGDESDPGRSLEELVKLVLGESYWEVAALLSALALVHRYGKWYHSSVVANLVHACDVASQQYPHEARPWLEFMTEAAMGGKLTFSWLEQPVKASIRLSVDDRRRQRSLREFVQRRSFDADHQRLEQLYDRQLSALRKEGGERDRRRLFNEVKTTVRANPTRALRLLELMAMYEHGGRVGPRTTRLRRAIDTLAVQEGLNPLASWLVGLYVHKATLEPHAADLVRRLGERVDWEKNPFANRDDYAMYRVISDYERAFEQLTCKFDGVTLDHADKYAAARVKFFVQKRLDPSRVHRLVQKAFAPVEWLGAELVEIDLIASVIERGMERFEDQIRAQDLHRQVVEDFDARGIEVGGFDDIARLPVDRIVATLQGQRNRRLLLGAVSGGVSGGLAPFSWGGLSMADIPVVLSITADICSRFCWYFGFDPRQHPELPAEILAVALGGTRPEAIEPMLVRQNLHQHVVRKSLVVGAVAHGGLAHLTGRGLSQVIQKKMGTTASQKAGDLARRAVFRNLKRRAATSRSSRALPVIGALLGAALNTALLYDICEAAQAVLTDRFLERKYPDWARHFAQLDEGHAG